MEVYLKSQDLVLLLKLHCIWLSEDPLPPLLRTEAWRGWDVSEDVAMLDVKINDLGYEAYRRSLFTVRGLAETTGISKTQVGLSLNRVIESGIAAIDRKTGLPKVNSRDLYFLIVSSLKYIFPVRRGDLKRGIPTAMAAPVLKDQIVTAGEFIPVWPDPRGVSMGQAVEPLSGAVGKAISNDPRLYAMLALCDAIRIGRSRERAIASEILKRLMGVEGE